MISNRNLLLIQNTFVKFSSLSLNLFLYFLFKSVKCEFQNNLCHKIKYVVRESNICLNKYWKCVKIIILINIKITLTTRTRQFTNICVRIVNLLKTLSCPLFRFHILWENLSCNFAFIKKLFTSDKDIIYRSMNITT